MRSVSLREREREEDGEECAYSAVDAEHFGEVHGHRLVADAVPHIAPNHHALLPLHRDHAAPIVLENRLREREREREGSVRNAGWRRRRPGAYEPSLSVLFFAVFRCFFGRACKKPSLREGSAANSLYSLRNVSRYSHAASFHAPLSLSHARTVHSNATAPCHDAILRGLGWPGTP